MANKQTMRNQERDQLAAWLHAYELDVQLRDVNPGAPADTVHRPEPQTVAYGQIRLLPPTVPTLPITERPVFVLVWTCSKNGQATMIPFGRFDIPATPGEWLTGSPHAPLKVLCFWNHRQLPTEDIAQTWLADALPEKIMQTISKAFAQFSSHRQRATMRHGPPLIHPLDPRHIYLHEEKTLLDDQMDVLLTAQDKGAIFVYPADASETQRRQAAEDGEEYSPHNEPD